MASEQIASAKELARQAKREPRSILSELSELPPLLVSENPQVRFHASKALYYTSLEYPLEIRETSEALLARIDDVHPGVRTNILLTIASLSQWYPQDFADGTDLMEVSLRAEDAEERLGAAAALTQIGYYRPDLVTPREEVRRILQGVKQKDNPADADAYPFDIEIYDGALQALSGGDMASRPLEDDLAPTAKRTSLSKPVRIGLSVLFWFPCFLVSVITVSWRFGKAVKKRAGPGASSRAKLAQLIVTPLLYLTHIRLLLPPARGRLYVRRSPIATPVRVVPQMAGTVPKRADYKSESDPYPDEWGIIAALVRQRDGHQCRNCGALGGPRGDTELHVDHQNPRSRGGSDHPANLRTLCRQCHEARHLRPFN